MFESRGGINYFLLRWITYNTKHSKLGYIVKRAPKTDSTTRSWHQKSTRRHVRWIVRKCRNTRCTFFSRGIPTQCKMLGTETSPAKVKPRTPLSAVSAHSGLRSVSHVVLQPGSLGCIYGPPGQWQPVAHSRLCAAVNVTRSSSCTF